MVGNSPKIFIENFASWPSLNLFQRFLSFLAFPFAEKRFSFNESTITDNK